MYVCVCVCVHMHACVCSCVCVCMFEYCIAMSVCVSVCYHEKDIDCSHNKVHVSVKVLSLYRVSLACMLGATLYINTSLQNV